MALGLFLLLVMMQMSVMAARPVSSHSRALLQQSGTKVLTDYIGASGGSIAFSEVPLNPNVQYIFPLAFAIDADAAGNTAGGLFSGYWSSSLTAASAQASSRQMLTSESPLVWEEPASGLVIANLPAQSTGTIPRTLRLGWRTQ